jgi:hypothetical protein
MWAVLEDAVKTQIIYGTAVMSKGESASDEERNRARALRIQAEYLYRAATLEPRGISRAELDEAKSVLVELTERAAMMLALSAEGGRDERMVRAISASEELLASLDRMA